MRSDAAEPYSDPMAHEHIEQGGQTVIKENPKGLCVHGENVL
jgi:hypothetical protein